MLHVALGCRVLDIGCGVGRWAESILSSGGIYVGADYSEPLLQLARDAHSQYMAEQCKFICSSFQTLDSSLPEETVRNGFDIILINGVMMYINDSELHLCMDVIRNLLIGGGTLYIKESIAYNERLTLDHVYSDELSTEYSAIYRCVTEYESLLRELGESYEIIKKGEMWETDFKNRRETTAYYWLMKKHEEGKIS